MVQNLLDDVVGVLSLETHRRQRGKALKVHAEEETAETDPESQSPVFCER